jgi:hypothetical protein
MVIREQTLRSFQIFQSAGLRSLRMYGCRVEDFNSIPFLYGVEELHLKSCQIKDISPIEKLRGLTRLSLVDNGIDDISALSGCRELTWLDLRNNRIDSISALGRLHKLTHVDLRDNPLGLSPDDGTVQLVRANNPGVRILLGNQSDTSLAELERQISDGAKVAEFALRARLQYIDGVVQPLLPSVPHEVSDVLGRLRNGADEEYLADIAALLMKYVIEVEDYYRPGPVWGRGEEPLLDAFLDGVALKVSEEGLPVLSVADWICDNRDKLAPSVVLDMQIERRRDLHTRLKRKGVYGPGDTGRTD